MRHLSVMIEEMVMATAMTTMTEHMAAAAAVKAVMMMMATLLRWSGKTLETTGNWATISSSGVLSCEYD